LSDQNTSFEPQGWFKFLFLFFDSPFTSVGKCDGMCYLNLTIFCDGCILNFFGF
jgi:hypothetical protein